MSIWDSEIETPEAGTEECGQEVTTDSRKWPQILSGRAGISRAIPLVPASLPGRSKTRLQDPEALSALFSSKFPQLVPMKGEHGGGGGGVSREEVVIQTGPRLCWALGKCQAPPPHLPPPAK